MYSLSQSKTDSLSRQKVNCLNQQKVNCLSPSTLNNLGLVKILSLKPLLALMFLLNAMLFSSNAYSHQTSTGYFSGDLNSNGAVNGELQIRLFDLESAVGLDQDGNGELTWGEALLQADAVEKYIAGTLRFQRNQQDCKTSFAGTWELDSHFNEPYLVLPVSAQCAIAGNLSVNYVGFFNRDSEHKLLFSLQGEESSYSRVLSNDSRTIKLDTANGSRWDTFQEFTEQGAIHIWIGLDHILFLMCLLLATVFGLEKLSFQRHRSLRENSWEIITVVTAFTLAHSITLAAVALNWINVSSTWVEVGIAITVLAAALNNIFPIVKNIILVTFGFGLLHGMGFAGVLGELGLPSDQKLLTVLAFNLGVEFGQLVIIAAALPLMVLINKYNIKPRYFLTAGSTVIAVIAAIWIVERVPL